MRKLARLVELILGLLLQAFVAWQSGWWAAPAVLPAEVLPVLLVLGALLYSDGLSRFEPDTRKLDFWVYLCLCLFLPVYGGIGSFLVFEYRRRRSGKALLVDGYADYIRSAGAEDQETADPLADGSVEQMVSRELSIQSYMDIMRGVDRTLKKALIAKILQEWTPSAVDLLKVALRDEVYEIRSFAATALTTIEDRVNRNIQDMRRSVLRSPDDASLKLKLAESYLGYAGSGLLDSNSSHHYAEIALGILEEAAAQCEEAESLRLSFMVLRGQAARLLGDRKIQRASYEEILGIQPDHQETLGHMCEFCFRDRDFEGLTTLCDRFLALADDDHPAASAAKLWASQRQEEDEGVSS